MRRIRTNFGLAWNKFRNLAAVIAVFLTTAPAAHGIPIDYVFAPGASTTLNGDTLAITGSFTFDLTGQTETNMDVTMSGAGPYADHYTLPKWTEINPSYTYGIRQYLTANPDMRMQIAFAHDLDVAVDPLIYVTIYNISNPSQNVIDYSPTGYVYAVPEPSTVAFAGIALGLFIFRPRANRRRGTITKKISI